MTPWGVSASGGGFGSGDITVHGGGGGVQVNDNRPRDLWVRLTANPSGSRYGWQQVLETDPSFPDYEADGFAFSSSGDVGSLPAYEVNGVSGLPVGEDGRKVRIALSPSQAFYLFDAGGGSGGGGGGGAGFCGWLAGVDETYCFTLTVVSAAGRCAGIDTDQTLRLLWDEDVDRFASGDDAETDPEDDFVHDGGLGPVLFWVDAGRARMTIDGVEGVLAGCGGTAGAYWVEFAFGSTLCDGENEPCGDNTFVVRLTCGCFIPTECCPANGLPATLYVTFTGGDCDCLVLGVPYPLTYDPAIGVWYYSESPGCDEWDGLENPATPWPQPINTPGFDIAFGCGLGTFALATTWRKSVASNGGPPLPPDHDYGRYEIIGAKAVPPAEGECDPLFVEFASADGEVSTSDINPTHDTVPRVCPTSTWTYAVVTEVPP